MPVKKPYERTRVQTHNTCTKTKCVQSEARSSDINNIVARAHKSGQLPVLMNRNHIPNLPDNLTYLEAMNTVVQATQAFERLPSAVRAEFQNKPENLLHAVHNCEGNEKMTQHLQSLGILEKPPIPPLPAEKNGRAEGAAEGPTGAVDNSAGNNA